MDLRALTTIQWTNHSKLIATSMSRHPPAVATGWIRGELRRLALGSSKVADYVESAQKFFCRLLARDYNHPKLERLFAKNIYPSYSREERLKQRTILDTQPNEGRVIPVVVPLDVTTANPLFRAQLQTLLQPLRKHLEPHRPVIAWTRGLHMIEEVRRV